MMPRHATQTLGGTMQARRAAFVALLVAATATGCGSGKPTPRVTVTETATATPKAAAAANKDTGVLTMGAKKTVDDTANNVVFTVQAVEYQQPYKGPQPQKPDSFQGGDIWATANVKVCNLRGVDITVDQFPWSLAYADGTRIQITGNTGGDMPKPEYPMGKTVQPGRCAAGLIAFPVPSKKRPERVVYEPEGSTPTEWAVPKA